MDDKNRQKILDILNGMTNNDATLKKATEEMAKTTKMMLDAFENEGVDHYDAMSIICSVFTGVFMGGKE